MGQVAEEYGENKVQTAVIGFLGAWNWQERKNLATD
jgi:hypothetical protein